MGCEGIPAQKKRVAELTRIVRRKHVSRNFLPDLLFRYFQSIEKDVALLAISLAFLYATVNKLPLALFELLSKVPTLELRLILGFPIADSKLTSLKGVDSDPRCRETKVLLHIIDGLGLSKAKIP